MQCWESKPGLCAPEASNPPAELQLQPNFCFLNRQSVVKTVYSAKIKHCDWRRFRRCLSLYKSQQHKSLLPGVSKELLLEAEREASNNLILVMIYCGKTFAGHLTTNHSPRIKKKPPVSGVRILNPRETMTLRN